jgi:Flp pilus assembly protein TadG
MSTKRLRPNLFRGKLWRRLDGTQAAEIAETAVVLPLLFVFVIGVLWFGQMFRYYGTITHAAREGARAAVAPACATCTPLSTTQNVLNAINAVNAAMTDAHVDPTKIAAPTTVPALCSCGTASSSCSSGTVACAISTSPSNVCVQPNVQLSYTAPTTGVGGAGTCGTAVSFSYKYPFHFALPCWPQPCTSLDLDKITLSARAQMRAEKQ